ncbi:MAG: DUF1570 domain-containing protein [Mariniblastus sp.]
MPKDHRLLSELASRRDDISNLLDVPTSDEPINVYLFEDEERYREYMTNNHPQFPNRRAFFVKNDTSLNVFAYWGTRIGEDLRHEVTHGYLHSVVPNIPLWLDEGIAEYFEVPRGRGGANGAHIYHLSNALEQGKWKPNMLRLESLKSPSEMTQTDYAESWLWVHFLLTGDPQTRSIIQRHLAQLRADGTADAFTPEIAREIPDSETQLLVHLKLLDEP